jgi:hypothetical protein
MELPGTSKAATFYVENREFFGRRRPTGRGCIWNGE